MQREHFDSDQVDVGESVVEKHERVASEAVGDEEYGMLIGGEWVESERGETAESVDATTGQQLARFQRGTPGDVDRAVAAAQDGFEKWSVMSPQQRSNKLLEVADRLADRRSAIARLDSLEVGKANQHSMFVDLEVAIEQFRYFASLARTADEGRRPPASPDRLTYTQREPYGVVGLISAWNFPAMFVAWKMAPALAAGNAVVFKPSSRASLSTLEMARTIQEVLPDGAVNVVTGAGSDVGSALTGHAGVGKVALTGSTTAGQYTMQNAAKTITPVSLELGGKSPNIVFPDADIERAVQGSIIASWFNVGQQCTMGSRLFLHEDVYDEFLDAFVAATDALQVGDPLDPRTDVGPLIDHDHLDDVQSYVDAALDDGATLAYGGEQPADAALDGAPFYKPTVLTDIDNGDTIACEEVFGPVLSVLEWSDYDEMMAAANDTIYGLAAGVWTTDLESAKRAADDLEAGTVWVNTYNDMFEPSPYGGYKQSGIGRELDEASLADYTQTKSVTMNFGGLPDM
ncbi:aldehyde dehydrogenase family protein [Halorientalis sp.]|uniref:aldehyde dehydrogenase family protein n=1 Tax=Halorientalis sp. TaxID=1931229 RepID=UPI002606D37F|nr:aldehyde dehydrogenase family protein [Halorientalis sp.]